MLCLLVLKIVELPYDNQSITKSGSNYKEQTESILYKYMYRLLQMR